MRSKGLEAWNSDPVKTEAVALEGFESRIGEQAEFAYLAVPWAPYLNGALPRDAVESFDPGPAEGRPLFSVCQHARLADAAEVAASLNVRRLYSPHCSEEHPHLHGVEIRPILHAPVVRSTTSDDPRYDLSFVGAVGTHAVRRHALTLAKHPRSYVRTRGQWHFGSPNEELEREEYRDSLRDSHAVLCYRGFGLGSIRLSEVLFAGALPVLVADDHALPNWAEPLVVRIPESEVDSIASTAFTHGCKRERRTVARPYLDDLSRSVMEDEGCSTS